MIAEPSTDACRDLIEAEAEMLARMVHEYRSGKSPIRAAWKVVPAARLTRIWRDAAMAGFVRDEKGLLAIRDRLVENYLRIAVNTFISGHSEAYPDEALAEHFATGEESEAFVDWAIETEAGGWRISDYGLDRLFRLAAAASEEADPKRILVICDLMLNVTHQRSDLASWFVEGGSATLDAIAQGALPDVPPPASA